MTGKLSSLEDDLKELKDKDIKDLRKDVNDLQKRVWIFSGGVLVLSAIIGWIISVVK